MPDDDLHGCHTCGAPVLWCVTDRGKRIAIDLAPNQAEGTHMKLRKEWDGESWQKVVCFVRSDERPFVNFPLYTCHFETCPNAKKNRDRAGAENGVS